MRFHGVKYFIINTPIKCIKKTPTTSSESNRKTQFKLCQRENQLNAFLRMLITSTFLLQTKKTYTTLFFHKSFKQFLTFGRNTIVSRHISQNTFLCFFIAHLISPVPESNGITTGARFVKKFSRFS